MAMSISSIGPSASRTSAPPPALLVSKPAAEDEGDLLARVRSGEAPVSELQGAFLADADLRGLDLSGVDLSGTNLARADLRGVSLFGANLSKAVLFGAKLDDCELSGADLTEAVVDQASLLRAGLGMAKLRDAKMNGACCDGASLVDADMSGADIRGASFRAARLTGATLDGSDATRACFFDADLCDLSVAAAVFDHADLREAKLTGIRGYQTASFIGADIRNIAPLGAQLWRRFVNDQNYLHEFRTQSTSGRVIYWVWWLTSDCGRSMLRWALCTVALVVLFGFGYTGAAIEYGAHPTWMSPFYFSVVTMTTLGFGDVLPASVGAQLLVMLQVSIGYLMLGGLITILSNKLGRRGD